MAGSDVSSPNNVSHNDLALKKCWSPKKLLENFFLPFLYLLMYLWKQVMKFLRAFKQTAKCPDGETTTLKNNDSKLHSDLIVEIISRLPPRSLIRFQLACKEWHEFICGRQFNEKYNACCPTREKYVCNVLPSESSSASGRTAQLLCGCDGMLLLRSCSSPRKYAITNPTTRHVLEFPDPDKWSSGSSFCYVPSTRNYRIVSLYRDTTDGEGFEVFTPGSSKQWRNLKFPNIVKVRALKKIERFLVVVAGEIAHCVRVAEDGTSNIEEVVSLDLGTEQFSVTCLPKGKFSDWKTVAAFDWEGKLTFSCIVGENLHLLKLEDYKEPRWGEKKIIQLPSVIPTNSVLLLTKKDEFWFWLDGQEIFAYTIGTREVRNIVTLTASAVSTNFYPWKPSFITVEGMKPADTIASSVWSIQLLTC